MGDAVSTGINLRIALYFGEHQFLIGEERCSMTVSTMRGIQTLPIRFLVGKNFNTILHQVIFGLSRNQRQLKLTQTAQNEIGSYFLVRKNLLKGEYISFLFFDF